MNFEIIPANPYSSADLNWTDSSSRVNDEHDNVSKRNIALVKDTVDNWEDYDTVFIGYPIWWGIAAWLVDTFVKANDFTGKTVIPFCTSSSSGLGQSGGLLAELARTGSWLEGRRFSSGVSTDTVTAWVDGLGLK
nr:flavodoxin [uncultured Oscillibacter sp.]